MMLMGTKRKINKKEPSANAKVIYDDVKAKADTFAGEMGENVRKHVDKARAEAGEDVRVDAVTERSCTCFQVYALRLQWHLSCR